MKNKLTSRIYKNLEDGALALSFKGMDTKNWKNLSHAEFASFVDSCTMWDDIGPEIYESALNDLGLDYHSYKDPEQMWQAYIEEITQ